MRIDSTIRSPNSIALSYATQLPGAQCVAFAPKIVVEPKDTQATVNQPATCTVIATGTGLTYAWYKGAAVSGAPVSSLASNTLTIDSVNLTDTGYYICRVYNIYGADTSRPVHVAVRGTLSNPLKFSFQYNIGSDSIGVTFSNLMPVDWALVDSVLVSYSIARRACRRQLVFRRPLYRASIDHQNVQGQRLYRPPEIRSLAGGAPRHERSAQPSGGYE